MDKEASDVLAFFTIALFIIAAAIWLPIIGA